MEKQASLILSAIQHGKSITVSNAYRLLDWLDKVRIGLWLGILMLQKEKDIAPRFSIDTRVGRKDRIAIIGVDPHDSTLRLSFGGTDTNLFHLSQCAIYLRINNVRILSLSADFLLTRETGLPHGEDQYLVVGMPGFIGSNLVPGLYTLSHDWSAFTRLGGTVLAQPIIDTRFSDPSWSINLYNNSRVIEYTKDPFRASGIEQFRRIIPLQLITNLHGKCEYHRHKRQRIRFTNSAVNDDAAFMRRLYGLMINRVLRNVTTRIKLPNGRLATWFTGCQILLFCMYQLRERLTAMGIQFPDTNELVEEIQRIDRILEEQHANTGGTLMVEEPLIG